MINNKITPAFSRNNIPVVLFSSNLFAPYASVVIQSIIDCSSEGKNYDIIVFERSISKQNKEAMKQLAAGCSNISIRFYNMGFLLPELNLEIMESRIPVEAYFRILAPYFLGDYEKIITIDSDMLLKKDIAELFEIDLEGACVGAVYDTILEGARRSNYTFSNIGYPIENYYLETVPMKDPELYVNDGIMVINCKSYCDAVDVKTILDTAQSKPFAFADQDVMNILFEGRIKLVDAMWNVYVPTNSRTEFLINSASADVKLKYNEAFKTPALLHWPGNPKPWVCPDVPFGYEWWQAAQKTPMMGHIIARMIDGLQTRKEYYKNRYGQDVAAWDPVPMVDRSKKQK